MLHDARVHIKKDTELGAKGKVTTRAIATIGDKTGEKLVHKFPSTSRVSKNLDMMTEQELSARMSGGKFFIVDGQLVDWRDGQYNGFVHEKKALDKFIDVLGFQYRSQMPLHRGSRRKRDGDSADIVLRKVWSENEITIPEYKGGADHRTELSFVWNPFYKTINGAFDLIRQICTNGMIGTTPLLQPKIPLLNRWEEHLDISSRQIQNKITSMVTSRIHQMVSSPATIADCMLLRKHAFDRLHSVQGGIDDMDEEIIALRDRLLNLMAVVDAPQHLRDLYQPAVFDNTTISAQLPAHISQYDAYNIGTEIRTHTSQSRNSSDHALDKFANKLMFGDNDDMTVASSNIGHVRPAAFSSPDVAFFGSLNVHNPYQE